MNDKDVQRMFTLAEVCCVYQLFGVREIVWAVLRARVWGEELDLYADGKVKIKRIKQTWKDDQLNGLQQWWYSNGQIQMERTWKDGKRDKLEQWWDYNGQKIIEQTWKNGLEDKSKRRRWVRGENGPLVEWLR